MKNWRRRTRPFHQKLGRSIHATLKIIERKSSVPVIKQQLSLILKSNSIHSFFFSPSKELEKPEKKKKWNLLWKFHLPQILHYPKCSHVIVIPIKFRGFSPNTFTEIPQMSRVLAHFLRHGSVINLAFWFLLIILVLVNFNGFRVWICSNRHVNFGLDYFFFKLVLKFVLRLLNRMKQVELVISISMYKGKWEQII